MSSRVIKEGKFYFVLALLWSCLSCGAHGDSYEGSRLAIAECPKPKDEAPLFVSAIIGGIVSGGITFITHELENLKEKYSAMDVAKGIGCARHGLDIRYERGIFGSDGELQGKPHMVLISTMQVYDNFFYIRPKELIFNQSAAKHGDEKDITVTYGFSVPKSRTLKEGKVVNEITNFSLDPFVIRKVKEGTVIGFLDKLGMMSGLGQYPGDGKFFTLHVTINEVESGRGAELAASIGKSISENINANRESIVKEIIDAIK